MDDDLIAGHIQLAKLAQSTATVDGVTPPLVFEMTMQNADKPPLSLDVVRDRISQFERYASRRLEHVESMMHPPYVVRAELMSMWWSLEHHFSSTR